MDGLESLKPLLTALALPPVPGLLLMLAGAGLLRRRAGGGALLLAAGLMLSWLCAAEGFGRSLQCWLLPEVAPLGAAQRDALKRPPGSDPPDAAIVVLGGGLIPAPRPPARPTSSPAPSTGCATASGWRARPACRWP